VLNITADQLRALPIDERALLLLGDMVEINEWDENNYLQVWQGKDRAAAPAVAETVAWLRGHAYIARTPGQTSSDAIFVTDRGHHALASGLRVVRAEDRLGENLHPEIERRARPQFLLGEYEQAVFVSMKAVEVRVRKLARFGDEVVGTVLMTQAFKVDPAGPLTDTTAVGGEQVGTMNLFYGAYAVLRNPASHREINYDDVTEAAEAVVTASLLMRILDRVQARLGPKP
jgi:uncharacterized protein (TIGR02391 family)